MSATRTLSRAAGAVCTGAWSFPAAFAAAPAVTVTLADTAAGAPGESDLAAPRAASVDATGAELRAPRVTGTTDFAPGDTVTLQVNAVGRWV